jgi:acyl-CoA synthetase (AMP-forming)/AMP-acid ligase II/NAD(P)-dependent dehydrogenase (short-subunit alcohol dehydrogenase family)
MIIRSPFPDVKVPEISLSELVLERADERGEAPAVTDGLTGRTLSYRDLAAGIRKGAAGLLAHGVAKGDTLALCSHNSPEFVVAYYAATAAGAVITTMNPLLTAEEMAAQLSGSGARWLITTPEVYQDKTRDAVGDAGLRQTFVLGEADGAVPFDSLLTATEAPAPLPVIAPDDLALLPYSSGTSGRPKGVMLTHRQVVASICHSHVPHAVREDDVVAAVLPLFHIFGMQVTMNLTMRAGGRLVTLPRFTLESFLEAVATYRVTRTELVPPIVLALAKRAEVDNYDLSSLRVITSGAAPLGPDLARAAAGRLSCRVKQGYGMTELSGASHLAPDTGRSDPEFIAPGMPGVESRIVDDTGQDVPTGRRGELLVRTVGSMLGYRHNPQATAETLDDDGWVHTGDIALADEHGWIRVVDRLKELIKYKGYQVAPAELEDVLVTHPGVADCAVVGSPDPEAGELPKAFVVLRPGHTADGLLDWVAERVAPYQKIRRLEVVDRIPKSASGKILRRELQTAERERVAAQSDGATARSAAAVPAAGRRDGQRLAGQVAMVTGASRGLGLVIAKAYAEAGAAVAFVARSAGPLAEAVDEVTAGGGTALAVQADVDDRASMAAAVRQVTEQLGPVDVLVNNAGITGPMGPLWEVDADEWWESMRVNLRSVVTGVQLVVPSMIARGRGRVLNITTEAGVFRWPLVTSYAVSKSAVIKLTENLAVELRGTGVSALSVHPGLLPIGLSEPALSHQEPETPAQASVFAWIRRSLESGQGVDPQTSADFLLRLAAGDADGLSGRHVSVHDDLDAMAARIDEVKQHDLYTLRRREPQA